MCVCYLDDFHQLFDSMTIKMGLYGYLLDFSSNVCVSEIYRFWFQRKCFKSNTQNEQWSECRIKSWWQKKNFFSEPKLNFIWILSTSIVDIKIFELILTINDSLTLSQKICITAEVVNDRQLFRLLWFSVFN